jgi:hypothetical protein
MTRSVEVGITVLAILAKMSHVEPTESSYAPDHYLYSAEPASSQIVADDVMKYRNIHDAAKANDLYLVRILINAGGNSSDALSGAIQGRSLEIVEYLVEDLHVCTRTSLHDAAIIGWWEGFDYLKKKGAQAPADLFEKIAEQIIESHYFDPHRYHAAHRSLQKEIHVTNAIDTDILNELIARGIKSRILSDSGAEWRIRRREFENIFAKLFHVNFTSSKKRIDIINSLGQSGFSLDQSFLIHLPYNPGYRGVDHIAPADWLRKTGKQVCYASGYSVFHPEYGWDHGCIELIGGNGQKCWSYYSCTTPLQYAVVLNDTELAQSILEARANPNYRGALDVNGGQIGQSIKTPLQNAVNLRNQNMIELLLKYNAQLEENN